MNTNEKDRERIKKAIYKYSALYGYGCSIRGALISALAILDLNKFSVLDVLDFILRYESSEDIRKGYECWIIKKAKEMKEGLK